jgi:hypothetical protein
MMPSLAIGFGALLTVLGVGFYFASETRSPTALIPLAFGVPLMVLGVIGRQGDKARKHAMHVAAAISLLGTLGGLGMAARALPKLFAGEPLERPAAVTEQALMGVLCAAFLALCIKSFIDARRSRTSPPGA